MSSDDGNISGTPTAGGPHTVSVTVTDSDSGTDTKDLSLTIVLPVSITTTTLGDGAVGQEYSDQVDATQGSSPYTWTCTDLPPGLSISSGDASSPISGKPTETGTYDCHVSVTDSTSTTDSKTLTITIADASLSITTTTLSDGTVGDEYSDQVDATGGTPPYTFSCDPSTLPPGLAMTSDGVISGTPTEAGDYSVNVTVEDSASSEDAAPQQASTDTKDIPLKVKCDKNSKPPKSVDIKNEGTVVTKETPPGGGLGNTDWDTGPPVPNTDVFCDGANGVWVRRVTSASYKQKQKILHADAEITDEAIRDATCGRLLVMAENLIQMMTKLPPFPSSVPYDVSKAHEDVHRDIAISAVEKAYKTFVNDVDQIMVRCGNRDHDQAIQDTQEQYDTILTTFKNAISQSDAKSAIHKPDQPFIVAQKNAAKPWYDKVAKKWADMDCANPTGKTLPSPPK